MTTTQTPGVVYETDWYPSVTHAYEASRFAEPALRDKIRRAPTEGTARAWGRLWPTTTEDWDLLECSILDELHGQVTAEEEEFDDLI